jgi:hypothetical protein
MSESDFQSEKQFSAELYKLDISLNQELHNDSIRVVRIKAGRDAAMTATSLSLSAV